MTEHAVLFAVALIAAATPFLLAAAGELVAEKAGVLNLGVEGMMLVGAAAGFLVAAQTNNPWIGALVAVTAGAIAATPHALLVVHLNVNQVASGLALAMLGGGVAAILGQDAVGVSITPLPDIPIPLLSTLPVVGDVLFNRDPFVYAALLAPALIALFLLKTRAGLALRAVGENPQAARAFGRNVTAIRIAAVLFGGACAGAAGGYLALVHTPQWTENLTAGRGWIALALVVFAAWRPLGLYAGALLFGGVSLAGFYAQAAGIEASAAALAAAPYLAAVIALAAVSSVFGDRFGAPQDLAKPFRKDDH